MNLGVAYLQLHNVDHENVVLVAILRLVKIVVSLHTSTPHSVVGVPHTLLALMTGVLRD